MRKINIKLTVSHRVYLHSYLAAGSCYSRGRTLPPQPLHALFYHAGFYCVKTAVIVTVEEHARRSVQQQQ